jgi:indole-3-glycerol phosphate synthase
VPSSRRLSQAISEGDGISVLVDVVDLEAAQAARADGAEGVALEGATAGIREATGLPVLSRSEEPRAAHEAGADAWLLVMAHHDDDAEALASSYAQALALGLECVVEVRDEEELERSLQDLDPEIFLLSPREADDDEEPLERVLDLLPDVPAGKLAIAELRSTTRDEVDALERAGVDAVLVSTGNVAELVGTAPPEV